jgi:hypothetical protein
MKEKKPFNPIWEAGTLGWRDGITSNTGSRFGSFYDLLALAVAQFSSHTFI